MNSFAKCYSLTISNHCFKPPAFLDLEQTFCLQLIWLAALQEFADKFRCHLRKHKFNEKEYNFSITQTQCWLYQQNVAFVYDTCCECLKIPENTVLVSKRVTVIMLILPLHCVFEHILFKKLYNLSQGSYQKVLAFKVKVQNSEVKHPVDSHGSATTWQVCGCSVELCWFYCLFGFYSIAAFHMQQVVCLR